jgi:hypothetical protein
MSTFLLLLGFALFKLTIGATLVYLGLRGGGRDEPEEGFGGTDPGPPPHRPAARSSPRRRRHIRGHPRRVPLSDRRRRARIAS